ncbi:6-pyruvoyl trahydropterin synthase family protein [Staphylococcus massiliensis]|uniref:6-carboxy-5,6,7,8-tetrahydropterin synthase n=1 Tax=Staphylococcus massiliensis S46 TaxID=1229783 RepID=K9B8D2_9STAP|nr:6-carboxytetrahydropterin synthase [Staphylococcus massiliensis]EKU50000.1 6-pyruvoyl tetrahydrobiopterin synthase [Staphylococcus massiliensis S46]MCG3399245.1 6-carboxytetrahydropterin synthase [Staphylococcus massiliensis]MCG3402290.1 6-carboxytetrahydropterin synthase [Staphylococcus massiliensis]MCG3411740.1 6-carboxytetrahydropterin synthase [Staphylococcus massiliensis]POA00560.1 6-pyruvoyl tetrahydrobiopterin synthase [Staphylococcus massiliensis CCUG 55927]
MSRLDGIKAPSQFEIHAEPVTVEQHFTFHADNRIFFSDTAYKDLFHHEYTFVLSLKALTSKLGIAVDFHEIDRIYRDYLEPKLNDVCLNTTLPEMNTTVENIGYWIREQFKQYLPDGVGIEQLTIYETPKHAVILKG